MTPIEAGTARPYARPNTSRGSIRCRLVLIVISTRSEAAPPMATTSKIAAAQGNSATPATESPTALSAAIRTRR
jgi:hypothetical protein